MGPLRDIYHRSSRTTIASGKHCLALADLFVKGSVGRWFKTCDGGGMRIVLHLQSVDVFSYLYK